VNPRLTCRNQVKKDLEVVERGGLGVLTVYREGSYGLCVQPSLSNHLIRLQGLQQAMSQHFVESAGD
jgi:hypothetical protein